MSKKTEKYTGFVANNKGTFMFKNGVVISGVLATGKMFIFRPDWPTKYAPMSLDAVARALTRLPGSVRR